MEEQSPKSYNTQAHASNPVETPRELKYNKLIFQADASADLKRKPAQYNKHVADV